MESAELLEKPEKVSTDHFLLKILLKGREPVPGQFINIRIGRETDPLLRRPFSVFDWSDNRASIIIRIAGRGTSLLSELSPGPIDVIGPFGKGFTLAENKDVLLVGGGVGNAPLFFLARMLKERKCRITYVYGHRSKGHMFLTDVYRDLCHEFIPVTDDGSEGTRGYAGDIAGGIKRPGDYSHVYACGPHEMMKKTALAFSMKSRVEVSIERYFGCGTGLCSGCTIECADGLKRVCKDGPVFPGDNILWDRMV